MENAGNALWRRLADGPLDDPEGSGARALDRLAQVWRQDASLAELAAALDESSKLRGFFGGVFAGSPYLAALAERSPSLLQKVLCRAPEASFAEALDRTQRGAGEAASMRDIMAVLRRGKTDVHLLIALADLGDVWSVEEVTARLSGAAELFVTLAVRFLLSRAVAAGQFHPRHEEAPEQGSGLVVLGMGKLGAGELNYSSDIDLVIFYDPAAPLAAGVEPSGFFVRLTRDLVHMLQERTGDGYVFRTDLRLRPDPGSTQAAISTEAALLYYESQGQNWERAAYIKARPVAGDREAGEAFLKSLEPYIWRKYLDYNSIADIHAMKRQIHAAKGHASIAVAGHNLKLGRGGIREIEFFTQSQQLIAGGRQKALRERQTLRALARLAELNWISRRACLDLSDSYRFLRRLEHRLQMVADEQTHTVPSGAELDRFARFAGFERREDFAEALRRHMEAVETHYAALFESMPELTPKRVTGNLVFTGDSDDPATAETLRLLGFTNPSGAIAIVKGWHFGRYRAMRSARAREMLTEFAPALLEALGEAAAPDLALATFDKFLSELSSALQLFAMLKANPALLRFIAVVMGSAPRLAGILARRRRLMDALLDPGYPGERPSAGELRTLIRREVLEAEAYEDRLDRARIVGQEQSFLIGAGLVSRKLTPLAAGEAYTVLAETLIATLTEAVQARFGKLGFPEPAVIAMGRLGGREMTAASDLDLIVVYDAPQQEGTGSQHYARFTQRLIASLSAPTAEGILYPVDMRLRPSGNAGPVAVRFDGFLAYQKTEAWTWEHLALTRARVVAGPAPLRAKLEAAIREVLTLPRDREKTARDVREMRDLIEREKGSADIWNTKNFPGGLIDVEFIAQFLQITHAGRRQEILDQNTLAALRKLTAAGYLCPSDAETLISAAELYQNLAQILRLCTGGAFEAENAPRDLADLLLHATGEPDLERLEARLREHYAETKRLFEQLIC